MNQLTWNNKTR